jgi:Protein of unknown function (DUF4065)
VLTSIPSDREQRFIERKNPADPRLPEEGRRAVPLRLPVRGGREKRLTELILYVNKKLSNDDYFGEVKLNKVLFFSDFTAFGRLGRTITGVDYQHLDEGPAARPMYPIQKRMKAAGILVIEPRSLYGYTQDRPISLRDPDLSYFSGEEIAIVDAWVDRLRPMTAKQVSKFSHDTFGWRITTKGQTIDPRSAFISWRAPTAADIERGQQLAKKHGLLV